MSSHINKDGLFQSDKYPTCPPGKVPLSVKDETAQDLLWEYAQRRRSVDAEFSEDLEQVLRAAGFDPVRPLDEMISVNTVITKLRDFVSMGHADTVNYVFAWIEELEQGKPPDLLLRELIAAAQAYGRAELASKDRLIHAAAKFSGRVSQE
jgi:hypothetical protein